MTDLVLASVDLDAIAQRLRWVKEPPRPETAGSLTRVINDDVPALLREVARLRHEKAVAEQEAENALAQAVARVRDVQQRRANAFRDATAQVGAGLAGAIAEVTTPEDVETLRAARRALGPAARVVLDVYADVWREWGRFRCGSCSATRGQSDGSCEDAFHQH